MLPSPKYHPYYCEENIWWLSKGDFFQEKTKYVVFMTNASRSCALWSQRLAPLGQPLFWDYHVILLARSGAEPWEIWDLDSTLPAPCLASTWFEVTIREVPESFRPRFRVCTPKAWASFSSDRRHMKLESGAWQAEPPPWPCIRAQEPHNLDRFLDLEAPELGPVFEVGQFSEIVKSAVHLAID